MSYSDKSHKKLHALDHPISNAVADFHIPDEDKKSPENRSTTNFTVFFYNSLHFPTKFFIPVSQKLL